jgi:catalase
MIRSSQFNNSIDFYEMIETFEREQIMNASHHARGSQVEGDRNYVPTIHEANM